MLDEYVDSEEYVKGLCFLYWQEILARQKLGGPLAVIEFMLNIRFYNLCVDIFNKSIYSHLIYIFTYFTYIFNIFYMNFYSYLSLLSKY